MVNVENRRGVRVIAVFEGVKAILLLGAAAGMLTLFDKNLQETAEHWIRHLHLNPAHHLWHSFLTWIGGVDNKKLVTFAACAGLDASLRLVLAVGLWRQRSWAEWLTLVVVSVYIPFEVLTLVHRFALLKIALLAVNLAIVVYLAWVLWQRRGARKRAAAPAPFSPSRRAGRPQMGD